MSSGNGVGGYGGPPPQGAGGYGGPPPQGAGGYGGPPPQGAGGYGGPPSGGGYGPPSGGGYGPPSGGGYGPPSGGGYGPPSGGGYGPPSGPGGPGGLVPGHSVGPGNLTRAGSQAPPPGMPGGGDEEQMRRSFEMGDARRMGSLDIAGLERALQQSTGLNLNPSVCGLLLRMHDADRSGTVSFHEFVSINQFIRSVEASFRHVDRDGNGVLTLPEIQTALGMNHFRLGDGALIALLESFDPMRRGYLGPAEFIGLAAFLTSSRDIFSLFDTNRSGTVQISFDQYCWIAGKLR